MRRTARVLRIPLLTTLLAVGLVPVLATTTGCKHRRDKQGGGISELTPPKDARDWESGLAVAYDNAYTPTAVNLQGRAPNDVLDQQLFQARLGHADLVILVRVEQVWGRGRYEGRQDQFLEVEVGETLLGILPKDAPERLMIEVDNGDELPGELKGEIMLLFLRWRTDREPPFQHHLMPADEELVALINAMVKHAQEEGVLNAKGDEVKGGKKKGRKGKKKGRKGKKGKKKGDSDANTDVMNVVGGEDSGSANVSGETEPDPVAPDEPPPPSGPEPDASTGLQDLGGEPAPAAEPDPDLPPES